MVCNAFQSHTIIFSTSDRLLSDVLLVSKVREIWTFSLISMYERPNLWGRERPWEAVWGRAPLIGLEICVRESQICLSQWEEHGLSRPLTASHGLSLSASHHLGLTQFVMWSVWANQGARPLTHTASQICADRPLTHTGRCSAILRAAWLISRLNALLRPESDRPVCVRGRDRTLKSVRPWESDHSLSPQSHVICLRVRARPLTASQIGLTDRTLKSESPKWEAVWEADRPLTHTGPVAPLPAEAMHLAVKSVRRARGSYSLGR